jgi:hypothetical protein
MDKTLYLWNTGQILDNLTEEIMKMLIMHRDNQLNHQQAMHTEDHRKVV